MTAPLTWYWLCCSTKCLGPVCSKYSILWWLQYKESYVHQWYKHLRHSLLIFKTIMHITIQQTSQGLSITFISRDNSASASSGLFSAYCERWRSYWEKNVEWRSAFIFLNGVFTIAKIDIAYLVHVNIKEINNPWNTVVLSHNLPSLSWDLLIEGDKIHELGLVTIKKSDKIPELSWNVNRKKWLSPCPSPYWHNDHFLATTFLYLASLERDSAAWSFKCLFESDRIRTWVNISEDFATGHESNFVLKIRNTDHELDPPHLRDRLSYVRVDHDLLQDLQTACSSKFNIRQQFQSN